MRRTIIITLLTASFLLLIPAQAHAAKGGGKGGGGGGGKGGGGDTSSVVIDVDMVRDENANGAPDHGDTVTFVFEQDATAEPHLDLRCTQGGAVVYSATTGYYDGYPWPWTNDMTLASGAWDGGAAECDAELYYHGRRNKTVTLGTLTFAVGG